MADVTISDTRTYTIIAGQPVELNIVIGDQQAGGTSLMLDGRLWKPMQEWEPVGADDLRFKVLHCVTTVRDINELSNHTSVTYTLRGGVNQQPFPYRAEVSENGIARYVIDFVFVT